MKTSPVTHMSEHQRRGARVRRAIEARRGLRKAAGRGEGVRRSGGRAWINGLELGGTDSRHLPLAAQFD
ncbi:MAG: hypothetical protein JOZ25_04865 [Actinobacteria bacterium]|nr:hypothetical protein [Actinomycetota bacterium]